MTNDDFDYIKLFIKNHAAIVLEKGKEYLVQARLTPIAKEYGMTSVDALIQELKNKPTELLKQKIVDAMTTNETLFFRDSHPFELLKNVVIPKLVESKMKEKKLVIWCAAASSGQEPYTIAIILKELEPLLQGWTIKFVASDIAENMLTRAKEGIYSQLEVNRGMPLPYLLKYFEKEGNAWRIRKELRDMIEYKKVNIVKEWPLSQVDIVFMRNILIYFDLETKKEIFKRLSTIMTRDSYLFLGGSETLLGLNCDFERLGVDRVPCYQLKKTN
ncbi:CheR family methyltransferase [Legionella dresdenensis]|uniref:protein-glutamate O-methyltransferase n=1 Tax=Legionella dresdenensis TaxID=450200 RepID=A0ABV8CHC3_9GAMM